MIDVIIPVYRGFAETRRCLESVLASSVRAAHEVIVVDDASPEPALSAWLRELAAAGRIRLVVHERNLGFVASVNGAMALDRDRDVVLLNSDTEVADGWLDRLAGCAARDPLCATVSPFSNNATICSYPGFERPNPLPDGFGTRDLQEVFAEVNDGCSVEVPTTVGFCMYLRRTCLERVGPFDEEAFGAGYGEEVDYCMRAARAGFRHRLCADAFVFHQGEVSFRDAGADRRQQAQAIVDDRYPDFMPAVRDWIARDPAAPLRERVTARLASLRQARTAALPPALSAADAGPVLLVFAAGGTQAQDTARTVEAAMRQAVLPGTRAVAAGDPARAGSELAARLSDHAGRDVVVAEAGVTLPYAWDARLRLAAHDQPGIGAAAPMCASGPAFRLALDDSAGERLDRIAYCLGDRSYHEVPGLPHACAYVRRDALDAALPEVAGEAWPALVDGLARAIRRDGRSCVLCDYVHVAGARPSDAWPGDAVESSALEQHHPLGWLRRAVADLAARGLPAVGMPGLDPRPVRLHVMHYWGGGLERWVRDFARADPGAIHLTLATYRIGEAGGQRVVLCADPAARAPVRTWDIARPIRSTATGSVEYRRILDQVVREFAVDTVVVSSLIGHGLDALDLPLPTVVVMHDLYPVCQAINPQFGKTCERCDAHDLARCGRENPLNRIFTDLPAPDWDRMRRGFVSRILERGLPVVVPSPWVARTLRQLDPRLERASVHVIGHGIDLRPARLAIAAREPGERLRLVVLGRLSPQKGSELLREAAPGLSRFADVTLLGGGRNGLRLGEACGWQAIESYGEEELREHLARIAPHAAVLASVVPETFSYTLSELFNLGIPALATDLGSFRERIEDGRTGFLFAPEASSLVACVESLHGDPARLQEVAARLATRPLEPSASEMAGRYAEVPPSGTRPAARLQVGIGTQTGLTEPYRHLTQAYEQLAGAYGQSRRAYDHVRRAYDAATERSRKADALWQACAEDLEGMRLQWQWWRAPRAARRLDETREKIRRLDEAGGSPAGPAAEASPGASLAGDAPPPSSGNDPQDTTHGRDEP